jgi:hypothetical protein
MMLVYAFGNPLFCGMSQQLTIPTPLFGCNARIDYLILFFRLVQYNMLVNEIVL